MHAKFNINIFPTLSGKTDNLKTGEKLSEKPRN
jgi:hypothetical protein